jgi:secreted trypsin-like serine protease
MFRLVRMRALRATVALAAVAAAGATAAVAAPSALAIENGTSISTAPPWAAYITVVQKFLFLQASEPRCTGTIVANDWVLTAAHCVMQEDKYGNPTDTKLPTSAFEVVLGRSNLHYHWQGGQWTVDQIVVDPDWAPSQLTGDVALLHLHGQLPSAAMPLPLAPSGYSLTNGQNVTSYGYGAISETYRPQAIKKMKWADYTPHFSSKLQETQLGSYTLQMSCTNVADWCMRDIGPSEILNGDSGGPWMPDTNNPIPRRSHLLQLRPEGDVLHDRAVAVPPPSPTDRAAYLQLRHLNGGHTRSDRQHDLPGFHLRRLLARGK